MPSAFPGMDPYLEGHKWRSFHAQLCSEIARTLSPLVRPKYLVRSEKIYISSGVTEDDEDFQIPDVTVVTEAADWRGGDRSAAVIDAPLKLAIPLPIPQPQQVFSTLYDVYSYDFELHYGDPPQISLPSEDADWAADLVRKHRHKSPTVS